MKTHENDLPNKLPLNNHIHRWPVCVWGKLHLGLHVSSCKQLAFFSKLIKYILMNSWDFIFHMFNYKLILSVNIGKYINIFWWVLKKIIIIWVVLSAVESYVIQLFALLLKQWGFHHDTKDFLLTAHSTLHPLTLSSFYLRQLRLKISHVLNLKVAD